METNHITRSMYYVYIMTNKRNTVLYVGMTNDIERRVAEHKSHLIKGFTERYKTDKCVFVEPFKEVNDAIRCEKMIKGWKRERKFELISKRNPDLIDLSDESETNCHVER